MGPAIARAVFGGDADVIRDPTARGIFAAHAILITGTVLLSPLIADLARVFAVSEAAAGLFIIAYTGTFLVALPVAGVIADRVGRRAAIVPGIIVFGLAGGAIALVDSFGAAIGLRIVQAVGVAFAQPVLVALLGDLYTGTRETTAQGMRVAADSALSVLTPLLAGVLFVVSWRLPFAAYLLAVPVAAWLWVALPEDLPRAADRSMGTYLRDLTAFVRGRAVGLLMTSLLVRHVLLYGVYTYLSVLAIREAGIDVVVVGVLLSTLSVCKLLGSTQVGRIVTHLDGALVVAIGFVLGGVGIALMGALPTVATLLVGVMLHGFGDGLISPTQKSLVNQLSAPEYRSGSMSVALTFTNVGRSVGPLVLGVILGLIGPSPTFVLLGVVGGGVGTLLLVGVWWLTR